MSSALWTVTMCGCVSDAIACASRRKRSRRRGSAAMSSGTILSATSRSGAGRRPGRPRPCRPIPTRLPELVGTEPGAGNEGHAASIARRQAGLARAADASAVVGGRRRGSTPRRCAPGPTPGAPGRRPRSRRGCARRSQPAMSSRIGTSTLAASSREHLAAGDLRDVARLRDRDGQAVAAVDVQHHVDVRAAVADVDDAVARDAQGALQLAEHRDLAEAGGAAGDAADLAGVGVVVEPGAVDALGRHDALERRLDHFLGRGRDDVEDALEAVDAGAEDAGQDVDVVLQPDAAADLDEVLARAPGGTRGRGAAGRRARRPAGRSWRATGRRPCSRSGRRRSGRSGRRRSR